MFYVDKKTVLCTDERYINYTNVEMIGTFYQPATSFVSFTFCLVSFLLCCLKFTSLALQNQVSNFSYIKIFIIRCGPNKNGMQVNK